MGGQALLSRKAGAGRTALKASFRAKLLIQDVREDSDSGREPEHRGLSLKLATFAAQELEGFKSKSK